MGGEERVLVIQKKALFQTENFTGFRSPEEARERFADYLEAIARNTRFMKKGEAEINCDYKQPMPWFMLVNPGKLKIYAYRDIPRTKAERELPYAGVWSFGFGDNIEFSDHFDELGSRRRFMGQEIIERARERITAQNVIIDGSILDKKLLGFINEEEGEARTCFGLVYVLLTNSERVMPKDRSAFEGGMKSIDEIAGIVSASKFEERGMTYIDAWTDYSYSPLLRFLGSLGSAKSGLAEEENENHNFRNIRRGRSARGRADR